ncbi:hypothetical protein ACJX0J_033456, partial [Zea mays]
FGYLFSIVFGCSLVQLGWHDAGTYDKNIIEQKQYLNGVEREDALKGEIQAFQEARHITVRWIFTTRLYTNSSSSTSTSVISTSTSAISTSTSASTNRIYNSDNKCGLSKTLMTEQNNSR